MACVVGSLLRVSVCVSVFVSEALPVEVPVFVILLLKTDDSHRLIHFFPRCVSGFVRMVCVFVCGFFS